MRDHSAAIVKAYLDNNIVSAIATDDTPSQTEALDALLKVHDQGKVELVTSELTLDEINRYEGRHLAQRTFLLLKKVPVVQWDQLLGFHNSGDRYGGWISYPLIQTDPLYGALTALRMETIDTRHVFVAAKTGCDVFLTCDGGILHHAASIETACNGLVVQKPSDFMCEREW